MAHGPLTQSTTTARRPAFGLLLPTRETTVTGRPQLGPLLELAEGAEAAGFDSVWAGDSFVARPRPEPLTLLAAVAARTRSVRLGTAVLLAALRQPVLFAHAVATLDRLAEGRLILGVGAGFPSPATAAEFAAAGVPYSERTGRLVESVHLCRLLWSAAGGEGVADGRAVTTGGSVAADGTASFHGRYWSVEGVRLAPAPHRPGGPPLWLAGSGDKPLRRTGRIFDGWLPYSPTPERYAADWQQVQEAAAEAGRPHAITPALYVTVTLDADAARAQAELEEYAGGYYGAPLAVMAQLQAFYAGSTDGCIDWLARYVRAGARHIILRVGSLQPLRSLTPLAALLSTPL